MPFYREKQNSLRILVPLKNCNPPNLYFLYEDKPLHFEHGTYFLNTNKQHNLFAYKDSYMIVLNIMTNEEIFDIIAITFFKDK